MNVKINFMEHSCSFYFSFFPLKSQFVVGAADDSTAQKRHLQSFKTGLNFVEKLKICTKFFKITTFYFNLISIFSTYNRFYMICWEDFSAKPLERENFYIY